MAEIHLSAEATAARSEAGRTYTEYLTGDAPFEAALNAALAAAEHPGNLNCRAWRRLGNLAIVELVEPQFIKPQGRRLTLDVQYSIDTHGVLVEDVHDDIMEQGGFIDPVLIQRPMYLDIDNTPSAAGVVTWLRSGQELNLAGLIGLNPFFAPTEDQPNLP